MNDSQKLTSQESIAVDIIKTIAILSVITAHVATYSEAGFFVKTVSVFWSLFGRIGAIAFFILGGFLYSRRDGDEKTFWKKKRFRIIVPWVFCSTLTYLVDVLLGGPFGIEKYLKWILGSGTWYYYIIIYTLFLFVFKWFYQYDTLLYGLIGVQLVSLVLITHGISTTLPLEYVTDYLNPLHWIGYFGAGILIRRYRVDRMLKKHKWVTVIAAALILPTIYVLESKNIYTYFHVATSAFCVLAVILIAAFAYGIAHTRIAKHIRSIGASSYCIYLLHMQIVQAFLGRFPNNAFKIALAPFVGLTVMVILIALGKLLCRRLPFGSKLKMLVGL